MLVLSRRKTEVICIGNDIRVTICRIGQGNVKIGITAPKAMEIVREELKQPEGRLINGRESVAS